eukprot:1160182-Pelagomonas_calceolata.AAC.5
MRPCTLPGCSMHGAAACSESQKHSSIQAKKLLLTIESASPFCIGNRCRHFALPSSPRTLSHNVG